METLTYRRRKVFDPVLRIIHAWNGLAILSLMATSWLSEMFEKGAGENTLWHAHIYLGYALVAGLVARLAWGLVGPAHARFSDMWHPRAWWNALSTRKLATAPHFGHDVLASAVYLTVYALLAVMAVTGLGLAAVELGMGPLAGWIGDMPQLEELFEEPHELIYNLLMVFVVVHLAALVLHERRDRTPLAQAMVSGYQYQIDPPFDTTQGEQHA